MTQSAIERLEEARFPEFSPSAVLSVEERALNQGALEKLRPRQPHMISYSRKLAKLDADAQAQKEAGDLAGARRSLAQALVIRDTLLGRHHADTAVNIYELCIVVSEQGDAIETRRCIERYLNFQEHTLDQNDPAIADTLDALARVASTSAKREEIPPLIRRGLAIRDKALGLDHPDTMESVKLLAVTLWEQGELAEARRLTERIVETRERLLGPTHPETGLSFQWLAGVLRDMGEARLAVRFLAKALFVVEENEPNSLKHAELLYRVGLSGSNWEYDTNIVMGYLKQSLQLRINILGMPGLDLEAAEILEILAFDALSPHSPNVGATRNALEHALSIRVRISGNNDPLTQRTVRFLHEISIIEELRRKILYKVEFDNLFDFISLDNVFIQYGRLVHQNREVDFTLDHPDFVSDNYGMGYSDVEKFEFLISVVRDALQELKNDDERQAIISALFNEAVRDQGFSVTVMKDASEEQPALPDAAPRLWTDRAIGQTPVEFIASVYNRWLGKGLTRQHVKKLDPGLYGAYAVYIHRHPDESPPFNLPSRTEINDRALEDVNADTMREMSRLSYVKHRRQRTIAPR